MSFEVKEDFFDEIKSKVDGVKSKYASYNPVTQVALPGQATKLNLCACSIPTRSFHITWIALFCCFLAWFCTTNIFLEVSGDFKMSLPEQQLAGSLSVTSTIIFRIIIAELCPKYGSRVSYIVVLLCTMIALIALALIQSVVGYIIVHIFLGIAGASFVVTEYHCTQLFAGKIVGSAQAITAGFGHFGGGVASFIAPLIVYHFEVPWRYFLAIMTIILFVLCFVYYLGSKDSANPQPEVDVRDELRPSDNEIISLNRQQLASIPEKIHTGGFFADAFYDYRSWILFACYAASSGVELTFYLVAATYFQVEFGLNEITSGFIVMIWSSFNLFARPLGGYLCDKYSIPMRAKLLFIVLFLESIFIILFGVLGHFSMWGSIAASMLFSICVEMAEAATFSIVAFIQPKSIGHVIGIVASGANSGAAFFVFAIFVPWNYSGYDASYSWVVLGVVVMICSFCALMIQFTNRELHDSNQNMAACYDLQGIKSTPEIKVIHLPHQPIHLVKDTSVTIIR